MSSFKRRFATFESAIDHPSNMQRQNPFSISKCGGFPVIQNNKEISSANGLGEIYAPSGTKKNMKKKKNLNVSGVDKSVKTPPQSKTELRTEESNCSELPIKNDSAGKKKAKTQSKKSVSKKDHSGVGTQPPWDDKDGYYIISEGEWFTKRFKMVRHLGQGTFGKVLECWDECRKENVAVKIIKAIPKYCEAAKKEIRVLETIKEKDPYNLHQCIHLLEWFDYRNHICMVFELHGPSVFDYMKANHFHPFEVQEIQLLGRQIVRSVAFLHDLSLIHTDLKPENVLLVSDRMKYVKRAGLEKKVLESAQVNLIDFGSATFENGYHSPVISTRHYRAPEVILQNGWSYPCDIWSIGCILVELWTGHALFQTHNSLEHLAMMERVLGAFPDSIRLHLNKEGMKYFKQGGESLNYPSDTTDRISINNVSRMSSLNKIILPCNRVMSDFLQLVRALLHYDPKERITAKQALQFPFLAVCVEATPTPSLQLPECVEYRSNFIRRKRLTSAKNNSKKKLKDNESEVSLGIRRSDRIRKVPPSYFFGKGTLEPEKKNQKII